MTDYYENIPFSAQVSEQWLLDKTYHARLLNGRELSVLNLTQAMQELIDIPVHLSTQAPKSRFPESLPLQKSSTFFVPISTWQEITQEEARNSYQQEIPVLLYGEYQWKHSPGNPEMWQPNENMRHIMYGNTIVEPESSSGTEYAVCYLDSKRGTFSNLYWKMWFSSNTDLLFTQHDQRITFLRPFMQFPFTTHYTVTTMDGQVIEYPDHAEALQGFVSASSQNASDGNTSDTHAPHFSYYHEVICPSGTYQVEFFGQHPQKPE